MRRVYSAAREIDGVNLWPAGTPAFQMQNGPTLVSYRDL